jgi:hypothetical protein
VSQIDDLKILQQKLKDTARYFGVVDGLWGKLTEAGILLGFTDGPDTALTEADYKASSIRLNVIVPFIKALALVEANGAGFFDGKPKILAEPHRFSKATSHRFDQSNPTVSYPRGGDRPYPKTQDLRYAQLLQMIKLDVNAGFGSASYGKFQIMGENFAMCGYTSSMDMAFAFAKDEPTQLRGFEGFLEKAGILPYLRKGDMDNVAQRYNGSAWRSNNYGERLRRAARSFGAAL